MNGRASAAKPGAGGRVILRDASALAYSVALAAVINFLLFIIVPALEDALGRRHLLRPAATAANEIPIEVVQPKKPEQEERLQRIRTVGDDRSRKALAAEGMSMRFSPDLGVAGAGTGVGMAQQELAAVIFEEGETDEDVVPVHVPPIEYPERARELGIEGVLLLELVIGRDGKVESVEILKSPHPSIAAQARKAVGQWRFKPAKNKGIPVRVRAVKEILFQLE
jgi:TonB family protein